MKPNPLRVALDVSPFFHTTTSGIATYLQELMRCLPRVTDDHFVWFYLAPWRGGRRGFPLPAPSGGTVRVPPIPPRLLEAGWRRLGQPSVRWLLGDPDVFHASHIWQPPTGRARAMVTIHDLTPLLMSEVHVPDNVDAHTRALRFAEQRAAGVLVDSAATLRDLLSISPGLESRARVVHLAPSPEFQPVPDRGELESALAAFGLAGVPYFLFTGTLEPRKNLARLLPAFREVRLQARGDLKLVMVGPPGWGDLSVPREAERLGIRDDVVITGALPRATLRYLMAGSLALVYPSLYEGFGIPPLEAMACGAPVVTSNVSSLPEVVGDAALLVDPYRTVEIAHAMVRLFEDGELRRDLSRRGLERAVEFSWDETARQTACFYHQVARGEL